MAFHHSPKIPTNGLVVCLDPANPKSMAAGGADTWYDLSPNNNNAVATTAGYGSQIYENSNGGIVDFSNNSVTADFFQIDQPAGLYGSEFFSVVSWFNTTSTDNKRWVNYGADGVNDGGFLIGEETGDTLRIFVENENQNYQEINPSFTPSTWQLVIVVYDGSTLYAYMNGNQSLAAASAEYGYNSTCNTTENNTIISLGTDTHDNGEDSNAKLGPLLIYNRPLTEADRIQAYQAHRGRYGL